MGIFSNLFGKKKKGVQKLDRVYLTREAANKAIIRHAIDATAQSRHLIIIYFFKETRQEFEAAVTNSDNIIWTNAFFPQQIKQAAYGGLHNTDIIVAETYPDIQTEEAVLMAIQEMGYEREPVLFYNGLNDPIFIPFGSERIQKLMVALGLKEDEPVEHGMITSSIDKVQKKIAAKNTLLGRIDSRSEMVKRLTTA